jgi:hypothetical protein
VENEAGLSEERTISASPRGPVAGRGPEGVRFKALAAPDIVAPAFLASGALEIAWLEARGEPVAALYNIIWGTKVYQYQAGVERTSPATCALALPHANAIRRSIELGRTGTTSGRASLQAGPGLATRSVTALIARRPGLRQAACRVLDHGHGSCSSGARRQRSARPARPVLV